MLGNLPFAGRYPGYLLPTVPGPFIASVGLGFSGWQQAAEGAFRVDGFLWLVIGALIFARLFTGAPLPNSLKPLLSVLVSAPATGGMAWFIIARGQPNPVEYGLLGILFVKQLVIGCVDPRADPAEVLGPVLAEAAVIRNVGGRVTRATLKTKAMLGKFRRPHCPRNRQETPHVRHDCGYRA